MYNVVHIVHYPFTISLSLFLWFFFITIQNDVYLFWTNSFLCCKAIKRASKFQRLACNLKTNAIRIFGKQNPICYRYTKLSVRHISVFVGFFSSFQLSKYDLSRRRTQFLWSSTVSSCKFHEINIGCTSTNLIVVWSDFARNLFAEFILRNFAIQSHLLATAVISFFVTTAHAVLVDC